MVGEYYYQMYTSEENCIEKTLYFETLALENKPEERRIREQSVDYIRKKICRMCIDQILAKVQMSKEEQAYCFSLLTDVFTGDIAENAVASRFALIDNLTENLMSANIIKLSIVNERIIRNLINNGGNALSKWLNLLYEKLVRELRSKLEYRPFSVFWYVGGVLSNEKVKIIEEYCNLSSEECVEFEKLLPLEHSRCNETISNFLKGLDDRTDLCEDLSRYYNNHNLGKKSVFLQKCFLDARSLTNNGGATRRSILKIATVSFWNRELTCDFFALNGLYFAFRTEYLVFVIKNHMNETEDDQTLNDEQYIIRLNGYIEECLQAQFFFNEKSSGRQIRSLFGKILNQ